MNDKELLESRVKELSRMIKANEFGIDRLKEIAEEFKVELPKNTRCGDCWKDFAFVLRSVINTKLMSERKYILKDGVDVIFKGERINNGMLTDKKAKQLLENGFAPYHFDKLPE